MGGNYMPKKLFRNCPYDNRIECKGCVNYVHCIRKKKRRNARRRAIKIRQNRNCYIFWSIIIMIITLAVILFISGKPGNGLVNDPTATEISVRIPNDQNEETTEKEEPTISAYGPGEEYYYTVTEEERLALTKMVYEESRGEPFEGKVAVAAVALNRWTSNDKRFNTASLVTVITQRNQFADISNTTVAELQTVPECAQAVDEALRGYDPTRKKFKNGATFFYAPAGVKGYQAQIRQNLVVYAIGNHNFHESF